MSNVIPFKFKTNDVRVVTDEHGEPWFVAKDVAELLGYTNPQKAVRDHCKGAKDIGVNDSFTPSFDPQTKIIPERDLYRLIMRSKLPTAEAFEEWVTSEVLPSIRKTGSYGLQVIDFNNPLQVAGLLAQTLGKVQEQQQKIAEDKPKVEFHDRVVVSQDAISVAKAAKILGTGRNRFLSFLRQIGWVTRKNEPYQDKIEAGLLDVKIGSWEHPDHGLQQSVTVLVTGKGLAKLQKLFEERKGEEAA